MAKFTWLLDSCWDRKNRKLEKDQSYDSKGFDPAVLKEWEKTGAIKFEKEPKEKKD